jgi:hypothetical protein
MATFKDEGLETSVYRCEFVAAQTGNASFQTRAKDLERRLKDQWVPFFGSISIWSDTMKLGEELATATGLGAGSPRNILLAEDDTIGGRVGTAAQEDFVSGGAIAGASAAFEDVGSSVVELPETLAKVAPVIGNGLLTYGKYLLVVLGLLLVFYVWVRAKG